MQPWIVLDEAKIPQSGETLRLKRRGQEFSIMLGSNELMNSRLFGSEEALATLTIEKLSGRTGPRILIGGLGMGFTLRAALAAVDDSARITVAELVPAVVAWARGPMAELHAGACKVIAEITGAGCVRADQVVLDHGAVDALLQQQSCAGIA